MGSAPTKPRRREGIFFDDNDAASPDVSEDEDRPNQPYDFLFTDVTCHSFVVSWKPPLDRDTARYQVRIFPPEGIRSKSLISSLQTPSYTFERLRSGTRYTVGVVAVDDKEKRSTCASASESTLPQPPTNIDFPVKHVTASTIRVEWQAPRGDRDYFEVEISPTEGVTGKTSITGLQETNHVFTGLVPGTEYNVTVVSVSNKRKSHVLEKPVITTPGHVYDLTFPSVTHNEMQVLWKPPQGKVECYTLKLSSDKEEGDPIVIHKIKQTSYKFNGLVTGRNYQCEIYTHASGKTSLRKTFDQCTVPSEVSNLSVAAVTVDEAVITWSQAPGDVEDYDLFLSPRDGVDGDPCPQGITGNSHTFKGLRPGTKYTVGVVTNSKDKMSQRVVTVFLTEPAPCGQITFPTDELKSTQIGAHWLPARGEWDSYTVLVIKDGGAGGNWKQEDITQPRYLFTDLTPGVEYTFNIATLREGRHSKSNSASCSTLPCPAGLVDFPAGGTTPNSIRIAWNPSAGGVDSYKIQAKGGGTKFEDFAKYDKSKYTISNLLPGTKYEISVSVISYGVESEPSTAVRMTGPDYVSGLQTTTLSKNQILVKWSPPYGGADAYDLTVNPTQDIGGEKEPQGVKATEYTFDLLVPGTLYTFTVTPVARGVWGLPSEVLGYTKPGDILNVHFPADYVTADSMKVVWGVEGNSKDVMATVSTEGGDERQSAVVNATGEHVFDHLQQNTKYQVKLEAMASATLSQAGGQNARGVASIVTQETNSAEDEKRSVEQLNNGSFNGEAQENATDALATAVSFDQSQALSGIEARETEPAEHLDEAEVSLNYSTGSPMRDAHSVRAPVTTSAWQESSDVADGSVQPPREESSPFDVKNKEKPNDVENKKIPPVHKQPSSSSSSSSSSNSEA